MTLSTTTALLAASGSLLVGAGPKVALTAPGHTPTIGSRWDYTLTVTSAGRPVAATLTEQIVDPIGGVHPVQFGTSTKNITNWRIRGSFRDFIRWPADARGIPLTFRVIVRVGDARTVDNYVVVPRR
jgi:hypothetical protein